MLDLEIVEAPEDNGLNIVSLDEMKKHLRIRVSNTELDDDIKASIIDAADTLHGQDGELNRTVFPMVLRRYLPAFPGDGCPIRLPYPPLIDIISIEYMDLNGGSPLPALEASDCVVRTVNMVPEVLPVSGRWPSTIRHPRAVAVTYSAGYEEYPDKLKRLVKLMAAHYLENKEATINEPRQMMVNRAVRFAKEDLVTALRVPVAFDQWSDV
jgi:hypothetical protein